MDTSLVYLYSCVLQDSCGGAVVPVDHFEEATFREMYFSELPQANETNDSTKKTDTNQASKDNIPQTWYPNTVIETSSSHCLLDLALITLLVYQLTYTPHTVFVKGGKIYSCDTIDVAQAVIENTYKNNIDVR